MLAFTTSKWSDGRWLTATLTIFQLYCSTSLIWAQPPVPWPDSFREDADLAAVHMHSPSHGWGVGERGTILHTADGGRSWALQTSPVGCRLADVHFADRVHGSAVGGYYTTYGLESRGVVLFTHDGGTTWSLARENSLPYLREVYCVDPQRMLARGDPSLWDGSDTFQSVDGGASWTPVPTNSNARWPPADHSTLGALRTRLGKRATASIICGESRLCIAHDSLARCQSSSNEGHSWNDVDLGLSVPSRMVWQPRVIAGSGDNVLLLGDPGSVALQSHDAGKTWRRRPTGHSLPIHDAQFCGAANAIAVGGLGAIILTEDGGNTWRCLRGQKRQLAAMGVFRRQDDIALEVIAGLSLGESNYSRAVVVDSCVNARELPLAPSESVSASSHERCSEAANALGCSGIDWLAHDPSSVALRLACILRYWQPRVVFVTTSCLEALPEHAVQNTSDLIQQLGPLEARDLEIAAAELYLSEPAQCDLFQISPKRLQAQAHALATSGRAPVGSRSIIEAAEQVGTTAFRSPYLAQQTWFCWPLAKEGGSLHLKEILGGLDRQTIERSRDVQRSNGDLAVHTQMPAHADSSRILFAKLLQTTKGQVKTLASLKRLTERMPPEDAARLELYAAERFWSQGESELAFDAWCEIARGDKRLTATQYALRVVTVLESSHEAGRVLASQTQLPGLEHPPEIPTRRSSDQATQSFADLNPHLQQLPDMQFVQIARRRMKGTPSEIESILRKNARLHGDTYWRRRFLEEIAIAGGNWEFLEQYQHVPKTPRPHLDGRLDEPLWMSMKPVWVMDADSSGMAKTAEIKFGRDDQYLFIGIDAERVIPIEQSAAAGSKNAISRQRDPDLQTNDRIELVLDIDRDYLTRWTLAIADDGRVSESLGGNPSWNPKWFVASDGDTHRWRVEAAIGISELGAEPTSTESWLCGIRRFVGGELLGVWPPQVTAILGADQLGYLRFSGAKAP